MSNEFDIREISGLTEEEAERRLGEFGHNEIAAHRKRSVLYIALDVFKEPMFLLLVALGIIYLFLGDREQALMLLSFVLVVIGITFYQERKSERALEALRDLSSPRANVIRSGELKRIAGRDVVTGDVLVLAEGDRVPADATLLDCANLSVDESLLTGESVPVRKGACDGSAPMVRPGGDDLPFVWSGTLVVQGRGVAVVKATGASTEMGKIGRALESIDTEVTPLQKETRRVVREIAIIGATLCVAVVLIYGFTRHHWLEGVLAGLTLAMAMLPEEFPVVLTIFLTMGAWRISKKDVLTRRVPAVETLGSASVLCVDKTGTLTYNRISVSSICVDGEFYDLGEHVREPLPESLHEVVEYAILACQRDPFDPLERAMKRLGDRKLGQTEHLHDDWTLVREYPLSPEMLALSHVFKSPAGDQYVIAAKGAPEATADLCHLRDADLSAMLECVATMADNGLRVIAVARSLFRQADLPADQHDFPFEFLGLVGLADPVRTQVPDSVRECMQAGIRVVMITGDYPGTARDVARRIGLEPSDRFITGPELEAMSEQELRDRIRSVNIFARVVPEQKLHIVEALKANGHIVAMTGDGVNDAPALKSAQIGIAMGGRGTDVARESAALVLLDDDFSSIVDAVRLGRRIYDNLKKAMAYILAVHVPIAGMTLLPVLFKMDLILLPVHIAFLELVIDPACSIVLEGEPEEKDVMKRPPRGLSDPLFSRRTVGLSLLQGLMVFAIVALMYQAGLWMAPASATKVLAGNEARALAFTTLVVANMGLILVNRSWTRTVRQTMSTPNKALWIVLAGTALAMCLVLYVPALQKLFLFGTLDATQVVLAVAAGLVSTAWFEALKLVTNRRGVSL